MGEVQETRADITSAEVHCKLLTNAWVIRVNGQDKCDWLRSRLKETGFVCTATRCIRESNWFGFRCESQTRPQANYVLAILRKLPQFTIRIAK